MTNFDSTPNLNNFDWLNKPENFSISNNCLSMQTNSKTDFWQTTHYEFKRDNGHCLLNTISGDFSLVAKTQFEPEAQYDQCGLFARIDRNNWIKCSTEFESLELSRLGSVVTNLGFSDWASQNINSAVTSMWYRLSRTGEDFLIENSSDGTDWSQMRITHLHQLEKTIDVGLYACSPVGDGFHCTFDNIRFSKSVW